MDRVGNGALGGDRTPTGQAQKRPYEVYLAADAPNSSAEGYRIVWIRSSDKWGHDAIARTDRIERGRIAVGELGESLRSKRSRLRTQAAIEKAVAAIVKETGTARWVTLTVDYEHRQERRGRPGKDTR